MTKKRAAASRAAGAPTPPPPPTGSIPPPPSPPFTAFPRLPFTVFLPVLILLGVCLVSWFPTSAPSAFLLALARASPSLLAPISSHWRSLELPAPRGLEHAFDLGVAEAQLADVFSGGRPLPPDLAATVRGLLGAAAPPAPGDVDALRSAVRALRAGAVAADAAARRGSPLSRAFRVVNVLWLLGIVGVCLTVRAVSARFAAWLYKALRSAWVMVLRPLLLAVWKPFACAAAAGVLLRCGDTGVNVDVRAYSCLSAALLAAASLAADLKQEFWLLGVGSYLAALLAAAATATGSQLLGFFAVVAAFTALGFGHAAFPGGYVVGFSGREALERCMLASAVLVSALLVGRALQPDALLAPFAAGVQTYAAAAGFLAGLIRCSLSNQPLRMWAALLAGAAAGELAPLKGLANTAYVFAYLHLLSELWRLTTGNLALCVFLLSCCLIATAVGAHVWAVELAALLAR
jgi:hypothetical protein